MTYGFYPLLGLFFLYSFAGWVLETAKAAMVEKTFLNRGFLNLPLCPIYGVVSVSFALFLPDLAGGWGFLFLGSMILASFVELVSGKLLEGIFHRKWWDYSDHKFQFEGYVCLKYSALWGVFGVLCMKFLNPFLLGLGKLVPPLAAKIGLWVLAALFAIDFITSAAAVAQMKLRLGHIQEIGEGLGQITDRLGNALTRRVQHRMVRAYPNLQVEKLLEEARARRKGREETKSFAAGCGFYKLTLLFFIGAFLGDIVETIFCYVTAGVLMSRSSVVYGPFSIVWGLGAVLLTAILYRWRDKSDRYIFVTGTVLGGAYEYVCSVFTELVFGTVFWDYSHIPFNLGGRINLLYCFFWGIAAVVWLKIIYPRLSDFIERIPSRPGILLTWVLVVFMIFNMAVSALAMARYVERNTVAQPSASALGTLLDERFPDQRMERIYPNAIIVEE